VWIDHFLITTDNPTSVDDGSPNTPGDFMLAQNYPNPFNPETAISFELSAFSLVDLRVFDLLGREIATLVNEEKGPGSYKVLFEGSGLSSGAYLYRLRVGGDTRTKTMVLLK